MRGFLLGAAVLFAWVPLAPASATLPMSAQTAHHQKALALAQTVQSSEIAIDGTLATMDKQIVDGLLANEDIRKLEAAHPGAVRAMWNGVKPLMRQQLETSLPDLWNRMADVYAGHMTDAQIEAITAFFRNPTGHKFLLEMNGRMNVRPMLNDAMANAGKVGQQSYSSSAETASVNAYGSMSEAERADIGRFMASDAGHALAQAGPDVTQAVMGWMNDRNSRDSASTEAAMRTALQQFLREHP